MTDKMSSNFVYCKQALMMYIKSCIYVEYVKNKSLKIIAQVVQKRASRNFGFNHKQNLWKITISRTFFFFGGGETVFILFFSIF